MVLCVVGGIAPVRERQMCFYFGGVFKFYPSTLRAYVGGKSTAAAEVGFAGANPYLGVDNLEFNERFSWLGWI